MVVPWRPFVPANGLFVMVLNSRDAIEIVVFVNGVFQTVLRPLTIDRTMGGHSLDRAALEVDMGQVGSQRGYLLTGQQNSEIRIAGRFGGNLTELFWGKLTHTHLKIDSDNEVLEYIARIEPFHFGVPLFGMPCYDPAHKQPAGGQTLAVGSTAQDDRPLVFNPTRHGVLYGNKLVVGVGDTFFLDPDSVQSPTAENLYPGPGGGSFWTLPDAVKWVCEYVNTQQQYILNPDSQALQAILPSDDTLLRDFSLSYGKFLPEMLDDLLEPFGFSWYVKLIDGVNRQIVVVQRGVGDNKVVGLQPWGDSLNLAETNMEAISAVSSTSNTVNQCTVLGDFLEIEATWDLVRAWSVSDDTKVDTDLAKDSATYRSTPATRRVWRDWVLNEAGDYNGLRPTITEPFDLSAYFGFAVAPMRRRFGPTLTLDDDKLPIGTVGGVFVEYSTDAKATWKTIDQLSHDSACHLLHEECGIRFDGQLPPYELRAAGDNAYVRVTATIAIERRLGYKTDQDQGSVQTDLASILIDTGGAFQYRAIWPSSKFAAQVNANPPSLASRAVDDRTRLKTFATDMRDAWNMADVSASIELDGLDGDLAGGQYELGDLVTRIRGRDIALNAYAPTAINASPRYVQIVGIHLDLQGQSRRIQCSSFRSPVSPADLT